MAKKKPQIESPDNIQFEEIDKIKSELNKDLKKLKPRKPQLPSQKRLKSMAQKKTEGVLDDAKQMYKDQIELKLLQKTDKELEQAIMGQQNPPQQNPPQQNPPQQVIQKSPLKQQTQTTEDEAFKGLKPKDLMGIDDEILDKYLKIKLLDKRPELAHLLDKDNKKSDLKDIIDIVSVILDARGGGGQKQSDSEMVKLMIEQQKQNMDVQIKMLEKLHEDKEEKLLDKIEELEQRANVNPFAWLKHKKGEMEELKDLFGKAQAIDPETRVKITQLKEDMKLKRLEAQERLQDKALEKNKVTEFTSLIRDGMREFSDSISKAVGAAIGEMGKQQLENINLPPLIPIDQVKNPGESPGVNPLLQNFSTAQEQQPILSTPKTSPPPDTKKTYPGGFRISETKGS